MSAGPGDNHDLIAPGLAVHADQGGAGSVPFTPDKMLRGEADALHGFHRQPGVGVTAHPGCKLYVCPGQVGRYRLIEPLAACAGAKERTHHGFPAGWQPGSHCHQVRHKASNNCGSYHL